MSAPSLVRVHPDLALLHQPAGRYGAHVAWPWELLPNRPVSSDAGRGSSAIPPNMPKGPRAWAVHRLGWLAEIGCSLTHSAITEGGRG